MILPSEKLLSFLLRSKEANIHWIDLLLPFSEGLLTGNPYNPTVSSLAHLSISKQGVKYSGVCVVFILLGKRGGKAAEKEGGELSQEKRRYNGGLP